MKRLAGWVAVAALLGGLVGMAWWLWPHFRASGPQRPGTASTPTALSPRNAFRPDVGATPDPARRQTTQGGSCKAWFATLKDPTNREAVQAQWLAAQAQGEARLNQWLLQTAQSGTAAERGAALYLKVLGQTKQVSLDFYVKNPDCRGGTQCTAELNQAVAHATEEDVNAIARTASVSRDPQLYGLAFQACHRLIGLAPSFCAQISADQWAQRDPGNGMAWLYAVDKASAEKRESSKVDAIYRYTQAQHFDQGLSLLGALTRSESFPSDTPFVASTATDWVFLGHLQTPLPAYQAVMAHCTPTTLRDANRAQVCNDAADRLLRDSSSLLGPTLGLRLGERLAWPAARLASLREEQDALRAVQAETPKLLFGDAPALGTDELISQGQAGCEARDRLSALLDTQMRVGEVQALRDRLATHKLPRAALAAQYAKEHPTRR